ncbi:MAG: XdhC family protein [Halioglobus sp.]
MLADHQSVLTQTERWCADGLRPWLCTIVETTGSSPRPTGSMLTCLESGETVGSLSGGCVEEDFLERLSRGEIDDTRPQLLEFGVSPEQNEKLGLPCGGRMLVAAQRINKDCVSWLKPLSDSLQQRSCLLRELDMQSGKTRLSAANEFQPLVFENGLLRQVFGPQMRMLLVGAGQLSHTLAELALAMDYEVLVTDPRQAMLDQWNGPTVRLLQGMPDDVILKHADDRFSVVITLTHDPRIDDMALMEALETSAWYVGALGSLRTTEKRKERLSALGVASDAINKLHAPVGLDIGSKTPIEIAVAIMAQLTLLRRTKTQP